jgi:hypothetical protein
MDSFGQQVEGDGWRSTGQQVTSAFTPRASRPSTASRPNIPMSRCVWWRWTLTPCTRTPRSVSTPSPTTSGWPRSARPNRSHGWRANSAKPARGSRPRTGSVGTHSPPSAWRAAFAYRGLAGVDFEWRDADTYAELHEWDYLSSNAWLVVWRVAERLVAEDAFRRLTMASPLVVGCGLDDDEDGYREAIIRLLNWPAGAEPGAAPDRGRAKRKRNPKSPRRRK